MSQPAASMPVTAVIILGPGLPGAAWQALLDAQPFITVDGLATDASQLATRSPRTGPAVVLLDDPAPTTVLVERVGQAAPNAGVLLLVDSYTLDEIVPLLQAGALGFVARSESVATLARSVIAAGRGEIVLPPAIASQALKLLASGERVGEQPADLLTEREIDVLQLLAAGHTNKDIAQTLVISVRTVEAHLRSVYSKLDVGTRTEAALWAVHHGYAPPE